MSLPLFQYGMRRLQVNLRLTNCCSQPICITKFFSISYIYCNPLSNISVNRGEKDGEWTGKINENKAEKKKNGEKITNENWRIKKNGRMVKLLLALNYNFLVHLYSFLRESRQGTSQPTDDDFLQQLCALYTQLRVALQILTVDIKQAINQSIHQ